MSRVLQRPRTRDLPYDGTAGRPAPLPTIHPQGKSRPDNSNTRQPRPCLRPTYQSFSASTPTTLSYQK